MDAFNWLHLTDLHWGQSGEHLWPNVRQKFYEDLARLHDIAGPWQAVLFTGDLVQKGTAEEFEQLEDKVLGPLWAQMRGLGSEPVLLAVPGNHDLQRPPQDPPKANVRQLLREGGFREIEEDEFWTSPDSQYREPISLAFQNFTDWWGKRPHCAEQPIQDGTQLPGEWSTTFKTTGGRRIGVVGLNTTFLQLAGGDYRNRLACDLRQFHSACGGDGVQWVEDHDACLLLTHQGLEWLDEPAREKVYPEINPAGRFAVHLFGHMHEEVIRGWSRGGGRQVRIWQGNSLFGLEHYGDHDKEDRRHGYAAGSIQFDNEGAVLRHWPRRATFDSTNGWRFIRDEDPCVLQEDGGTQPETISLGTNGLREDHQQRADHHLQNYQRHVQENWKKHWPKVIGDDAGA